MGQLRISVLVTSYGRSSYLERCLRSLFGQSRVPDEIVVVTRAGDESTLGVVRSFQEKSTSGSHLRHAEVSAPGVLAANRKGLPLVTGDVLCFIDDDAAARPDWIAQIEQHFDESPDVGAVGGRDLQHTVQGIDDEPARAIGRIRWYGRIRGLHHRRYPGVHPAEVLKGCNMSFRRSLVAGFDEAIVGNAQFYEMDLCFGARKAGYRIVYDGDLVVDHFVTAPKFLPGDANPSAPERFYYIHHNMVYVMMKNLGSPRRFVFLLYTFLNDAIAWPFHFAIGRPEGSLSVLAAMYEGKLAGLRSYREMRARAARPSLAESR